MVQNEPLPNRPAAVSVLRYPSIGDSAVRKLMNYTKRSAVNPPFLSGVAAAVGTGLDQDGVAGAGVEEQVDCCIAGPAAQLGLSLF